MLWFCGLCFWEMRGGGIYCSRVVCYAVMVLFMGLADEKEGEGVR